MWSKKDILGLMGLSGLIGFTIGTVGLATYVLFKDLITTDNQNEGA